MHRNVKLLLAFAAIYTIWGTTYLAIRLAIATIPPFFMAGARFLLAGTTLFALLRARGVPPPALSQWRSAALIGALLVGGGNGLVTWSEQSVPSGVAALIVTTVPIWMTLFDWLFYQGERPGRRLAVGLSVGFAGMGLLIGPGQLLAANSIPLSRALVLLLAPILWSVGSLQSRRAHLPSNPFMATAMEMLAGGVLLMLAGFVTGEAARFDVAAITPRSLAAMLYLTIAGSIVALTAYVWLLSEVQPTKVATYTFVNPIIALALGSLLLAEPITPQMIMPMTIIIVAVILITTHKPGASASKPVAPSLEPPLPVEALAGGD